MARILDVHEMTNEEIQILFDLLKEKHGSSYVEDLADESSVGVMNIVVEEEEIKSSYETRTCIICKDEIDSDILRDVKYEFPDGLGPFFICTKCQGEHSE